MEVKAYLNHLHMAPRKVRLVAHLIKGMDVQRAALELQHVSRRSSLPLLKLLKSAEANAANNFQQLKEALYVKDIFVSGGPVMKRMRPRAFGRGAPIRKRTSHVTLILEVKDAGTLEATAKKSGRFATTPKVREISSGDIKTGSDVRKKSRRHDGKTVKEGNSGFIKKVFPRKVI